MNLAEFWTVMPLAVISAGLLTILLAGAFGRGRYGTAVGVTTALGAALFALLAPPAPAAASVLGLAATPFARFFTVFFCLTSAAALLLSHSYNERCGIRGEEYPATVLFALFGMSVLAASVNLLTLFLGLEALTFAFYILTAIDRDRPVSVEAGMKYLLMGAAAAAFIAFGIALLYGGTGTLEIAAALRALDPARAAGPVVLAGWGFLLVGMAFKLSLVPAHLWTPDVYQGAPTPVTAFLATGSKAASCAALLLLLLPLHSGWGYVRDPLWALSLLSMTIGNLAALRQGNIKRMLAYSAVAQMGYVVLALLTGTAEGMAAVMFYLAAYTATSLAAFGAVASLDAEGAGGSLEELRGLGWSRPYRAGVLALAMFSLAGMPLTAGFMAKFAVFAAAFRGGEIGLAVIGVVTAVISVFYYLNVVVVLYGKRGGAPREVPRLRLPEAVALAVLGLGVIILGVLPDRLLQLALHLAAR